MSRKPTLYIAYGSNLNLEQMSYRCPTAKVAGTAQLQGYELLFRGGSVRGGRGAVATVEPKEGASVPVLLWNIREKDEQALDRYEGYPYFYRKEQMDVELNGRSVSAMVYVMNPGHELGLPGHSYYQTIAEGYESAGFDLAVLDAAVEESYNRALREERESVQAFDENQLSLFGDEPEMEQSEFACDLEAMVSNPSPEKTLEWELFTHTAGEAFGPGEENRLLYCWTNLGRTSWTRSTRLAGWITWIYMAPPNICGRAATRTCSKTCPSPATLCAYRRLFQEEKR